MTILFLDTEFTDLLSPELLSIGMVTRDGEEFYAELNLKSEVGLRRAMIASEFVKYGGVLDQWGRIHGADGTEWDMGRRAAEWLLELAKSSALPIEIAFDYSMDYELLEYAIRDAGLWDQVREVVLPINIVNLTGSPGGEMAAEECYRSLSKRGGRGIGRHHALADALALRAAYLAMKMGVIEHVSPAGANIFSELGFGPREASDLLKASNQAIAAKVAAPIADPDGGSVQETEAEFLIRRNNVSDAELAARVQSVPDIGVSMLVELSTFVQERAYRFKRYQDSDLLARGSILKDMASLAASGFGRDGHYGLLLVEGPPKEHDMVELIAASPAGQTPISYRPLAGDRLQVRQGYMLQTAIQPNGLETETVSAPIFERMPMDGVLYRLIWAGQVATQLPKMETARVRLWFARIDESVPGHLDWGLRPSGALSVLAIEEAAGSIPKMVLGSFWRDRTQQSDYKMNDEIVVRDAHIGPQTWDVVYPTDRVGRAGELRIGLDEYPLMGEDARGSKLSFRSAPLLRCRAESGVELLFPCYEMFRRFYALTSELANATLAGSWKQELAKLVDLDKTKFAEDGKTFEIHPRVDMRDIGCLGLAYFMTMPHAARMVSEIHPALVNARRGGQHEPWIVVQPPWQKEGMQLSYIGRELRSGAILVLWIYSSHFPEFPYSVVRIGEQLVVPILDEQAPVRPPRKELQVRIDELAESSIVPAADARLSRFAAHFELNESWTDLARLTRKYTKQINTVVNPKTEGDPSPKRRRRLSTGKRAGTGTHRQGSLSTDAQNTVLDRFKALAECFDDLLKNKWILKREDYPLVNPVSVGNFKYRAFPTTIGAVARAWAHVGPNKDRARLCWVSEITALDGSLYYWFEVETDAYAERKERFRALVVKPRAAGNQLPSDTLESILKTGVVEKAKWKKFAFETLEETVVWETARHAFESGRVTSSLVLGKLHALGAPMPKDFKKAKRRSKSKGTSPDDPGLTLPTA